MTFRIQPFEEWKRREQFLFYNEFTEPFYGISKDVDITELYKFCRENEQSLFVTYLYEIIKAVNAIEEFRYRIQGEDVVVFDQINVSATVARANETFGFSYMDYADDFAIFSATALAEIKRVQNTTDFKPFADKIDLVHFSAVPWIQFTSLSHARHLEFKDSIPKISTGKIFKSEEKYLMPVSVHAHHGLVDALHIGRLFSSIEQNILDRYSV